MCRDGRPDDPAFEPSEALYRRCPPDHIHEYEEGKFRVVTWSGLHNLSVVREKYAPPDHARWDSATEPENPDPRLYRDWYVVRVLVGDLPPELVSPGAAGVTYSFAPAHAPYDDLYSHSEVRASKNGHPITQPNKFGSSEVKSLYRGVLSNRAIVVLKPDEIDAPAAPVL